MMRKEKFELSSDATLTLQDLFANVSVRSGSVGIAQVVLGGEEDLVKQIEVLCPSSKQLTVKGSDDQRANVTIVSGSGRSSVRISGSVSDLVVVNGQVISSGRNVTVVNAKDPVKIEITVPEGVDLDISDVEMVDAKGLGGRLIASLSGQNQVSVEKVREVKASCSGQSRCLVNKASGNVRASCSGQSRVTVTAEEVVMAKLEDVEAEASGQSTITIVGNCKDFSGETSGQSSITLSGKVSGRVRKRSSGQSQIQVG